MPLIVRVTEKNIKITMVMMITMTMMSKIPYLLHDVLPVTIVSIFRIKTVNKSEELYKI